jgi:hypothetical protein
MFGADADSDARLQVWNSQKTAAIASKMTTRPNVVRAAPPMGEYFPSNKSPCPECRASRAGREDRLLARRRACRRKLMRRSC